MPPFLPFFSFKRRPDPVEETPLAGLIREIIAKEGPITIRRYMELALHHPTYGYYRQGNPLGFEGDFSTGPETSQMFSEMIGVWCLDVWKQLGSPESFSLLELGPGRGTLMATLLRATKEATGFHEAMKIYLMESNATLRDFQKEKLSAYASVYIENFDALPALPLIVIGNEFFDTFPLSQFIRRRGVWRERLVDFKKGKLVLSESGAKTEPEGLRFQQEKKKEWVHEISPLSLRMVQDLSKHIARHGGAGLLVDYGYDAPTGDSTLFALRRHRRPDILSMPGRTDVTADVDFGAFRLIAEAQGLKTFGPIEQGVFLRKLGLEQRAELLRQSAPGHALAIAKELRHLLHPDAMGQWFKSLAFGSNFVEMPGF